jgi:hypothetical protein
VRWDRFTGRVEMLTEGERAPRLTGTSYDGRPFNIGTPGRRTVLWFFPEVDTGG